MNLPTTDEILDDLSFFDSWEERYKYIIDLGKALPAFPQELQTPERLVKGCQSNVWLEVDRDGDVLTFLVDSDAIIVKGLLVLVLAAYNNKTPQEIVDFDIEDYFTQLDLERHISPTRGNGLKAIVAKINAIAKACLA
ncbi:SufE family protein [Paraneptunicella aestuarii]|uniref:SufE family protein n=1 Tax=Paraneptunicella aestuarii TaxID=2831148 RepID=UPI001E2C7B08|nr:SufE family protein [Paraneptunicella aestuarii]UAA40548.1 SufE family protein [Paraneptunicella aestuarii]